MLEDGERRAAEMDEAANMIVELSIPARMSRSAALWQRQMAELRIDNLCGTLGERADQIIQKFNR